MSNTHTVIATATTQTQTKTMLRTTTNNNTSKNIPVTQENQLRPLSCVAQQYAWGRLGSSSEVARLKEAQTEELQQVVLGGNQNQKNTMEAFTIDESQPYAELWLGTHPNGMSQVMMIQEQDEKAANTASPVSLIDYVSSNSKLHCGNEETKDLSFLLKVLSVRKVLSIQAHPDKKLAEKLHAEHPSIYKDPNHKPEMAIALSEKVRAMCGFRPIHEILAHIQDYPEFASLLGESVIRQLSQKQGNEALKCMFQTYIETDEQVMQKHVAQLVERIRSQIQLDDLQKLILQLEEQFPGDCGIFAPLIFNIVELRKNEGLYIGANEPHAYISGDILECMACSDNVVRAGLTPKLKDTPTLVNMLTYNTCTPDIHRGRRIDTCTTRYEPPCPDFCVESIHVEAGTQYEMDAVDSPSILLTLEGDATLCQSEFEMDVAYGSAAFCSANTTVTVVAGPYGVRMTRAFTNMFHSSE